MLSTYKISFHSLLELFKSQNLLENYEVKNIDIDQNYHLKTDSRKVSKEDFFLAYDGATVDGHDFLDSAYSKGSVFFVMEKDTDFVKKNDVSFIRVKDARKAYSFIWSQMCENPQEKIKMIGVTGTNGKSSTTFMIHQLLQNAGKKSLLLGTLGNFFEGKTLETNHTTPDPEVLYPLIQKAVDKDYDYVIMEVASHAIAQHKISPICFDAVGFTSFSRDHLDFHETMENYFEAKWKLFSVFSKKDASKFCHTSVKGDIEIYGKSLEGDLGFYGAFRADFEKTPYHYYKDISHSARGTSLTFSLMNESMKLQNLPYFVEFQLDNFLLATLIVKSELKDAFDPNKLFKNIPSVKGRLELIKLDEIENAPAIFIDYAHTPDALEKALVSLKSLKSSKLTVVVGCGGDRDKGKRPIMANLAVTLADQVILTTDNPRFEKPEDIIDDMLEGLKENISKSYKVVIDRKKALQEAVLNAIEGEIILVAGKGHELYQDIEGVKYPFIEKEILQEALKKRLQK